MLAPVVLQQLVFSLPIDTNELIQNTPPDPQNKWFAATLSAGSGHWVICCIQFRCNQSTIAFLIAPLLLQL